MTISRGEVWLVNLNPTVGAEMRKSRPVVVISSDAVGTLPIRLVAPVTEWKDSFADKTWLVRIEPTAANGLMKTSAVDALQLRGVDTSRFQGELGAIEPDALKAIVAAVVAVVDHEP
jgi:mRNA interferase MazF